MPSLLHLALMMLVAALISATAAAGMRGLAPVLSDGVSVRVEWLGPPQTEVEAAQSL